MKKALSAIKELDLFSSQIGLHMNKSFYFKTQVGGAASILAIAFVTAFFWASNYLKATLENKIILPSSSPFFFLIKYLYLFPGIVSFFRQDDVIVSTNSLYNVDPPLSDVGATKFMFALRISQPNGDFITNPYFNITVQQRINKKLVRCLGEEILSVFDLSEMIGQDKQNENILFPHEQTETLRTLPASMNNINSMQFNPLRNQLQLPYQQSCVATPAIVASLNDISCIDETENHQNFHPNYIGIDEIEGRTGEEPQKQQQVLQSQNKLNRQKVLLRRILSTIQNDNTWENQQKQVEKDELPSIESNATLHNVGGESMDEQPKKVSIENYQSCSEFGNILGDKYLEIPSEQQIIVGSQGRQLFQQNKEAAVNNGNAINSPHSASIVQFRQLFPSAIQPSITSINNV